MAAVLVAASLPAMEQGSQSTLDAHVAPQQSSLDATIMSMVERGVIANVSSGGESTAGPQLAAPLRVVAAEPESRRSRTQWRSAGQRTAPNTSKSGGNLESHIPLPPVPPPAVRGAAGKSGGEVATPKKDVVSLDNDAAAPDSDGGASAGEPSPGPSTKDDELAPIDELSETPAPATDAPGDPVEPEFTGPALPDNVMPAAKPLSSAPKAAGSSLTPIGEPDRIAKQDLTSPPASPEHFEQAEEAAPQAKSLPPLTRNQLALRDKVRRVLKHYYNRPLSAADRSPWEVMHAMLAFEVHSRVLQSQNGQPITAVGWLCFNQPCENRSLLYLNEDGDMRVKVGPALQGHHGQLLALLAQARVRSDYPMKVQGKDFTVADLIEVEKATCYPKTELTFKLIGLQRYLDINDKWVNDQGMQWDFPTLVREELHQPVRTAACGGTHRLAGLSMAVKKRRSSGLPVDGAYAEAEKYVANYINYAYSLQNPDGSFSTEWFKGPGHEADIDRRLKTTGHTLELMINATPEQQLTHYRTVRAVNYLSNIMYSNRTRDWEAGPLGHAIHALVLYDRVVFSKYDAPGAGASPVAQRPSHVRDQRTTR